MTDDVILTRPQQIASMSVAIAELGRASLTMRDALRESNDERHQAFFSPVLNRIDMIVGNECPSRNFLIRTNRL